MSSADLQVACSADFQVRRVWGEPKGSHYIVSKTPARLRLRLITRHLQVAVARRDTATHPWSMPEPELLQVVSVVAVVILGGIWRNRFATCFDPT